MTAAAEVSPQVGIAPVVAALGLSRATFYRRRQGPRARRARPASPRALTADEQQAILAVLHEPRFADQAPTEIYATLLEEGTYLCSIRTMYRLLAACGEVRERRNQLRHRCLRQARALGHRPQPGLVLGHHEAERPRDVVVLLPLRDPRHLQPLCRGLDGGPAGSGGAGPAADRRHPGQAAHCPGPTHAPCRPGTLHEI